MGEGVWGSVFCPHGTRSRRLVDIFVQTGSSVVGIFLHRERSNDKRGDKPVVLAGGGGRISWPTHIQTQIKTHSHTPGTKPEQEAAGVVVLDHDHYVKITCRRVILDVCGAESADERDGGVVGVYGRAVPLWCPPQCSATDVEGRCGGAVYRCTRDVQSDARLEERERNGGVMQGRMVRTGREFSFLRAFVCLACFFLSSCSGLTRAQQATKSHCSL